MAGYENYEATQFSEASEGILVRVTNLSPEPPLVMATPGPTRTISRQQIEQIRKNSAPQTIQALENSEDPLNEPHVTCCICSAPYHTEFEPGVSEHPFMTACGHVLGAACLKKWRM
jgi:hypothetical protein